MATTTKRMHDPEGNEYLVDVDDEDESEETKERDEMMELVKDLTWLRKQRELAESKSNGKGEPTKSMKTLRIGRSRSNGR